MPVITKKQLLFQGGYLYQHNAIFFPAALIVFVWRSFLGRKEELLFFDLIRCSSMLRPENCSLLSIAIISQQCVSVLLHLLQ